ncbi:helix-turn-helix transcriptional regulator [Phyllobacterium meliloti]|uniref:helix-turn-helix transcriptional regulator n=1 Tax=Phyllobacterium meliloti TaxID=555317 RepID=UPI001D154DC8|nr:hypothetical protein [Phyllobacterium sp. T1293]UGX89248.1 hypothetical protein LLE53_022575 [Phyllobacterium sp. T1293]
MIEPTLAQVIELIGLIYQAAHNPEQWNPAVKTIREFLDSPSIPVTNHSIYKLASNAFSANPGHGYFPNYSNDLDRSQIAGNFSSNRGPENLSSGTNVFDISQYSRRDFGKTRVKSHNPHARSYDDRTTDNAMLIDITRNAKPDTCNYKDVEIFELLVPHFERASLINKQIKIANALRSTFSRLSFGMMLVTPDLRILEINDIAKAWLTTDETALTLRDGFLAAKPHILRPLRKLIAETCGYGVVGGTTGSAGRIVLERRSETGAGADCVLEVAPAFDASVAAGTNGYCATVVLKKIHMGNSEGLNEHIRAVFKLTPSEARLACLIASGLSLKDAAKMTNLKNSTARAYVERLFHKTGTHQQSQLVALLKNTAPALIRSELPD